MPKSTKNKGKKRSKKMKGGVLEQHGLPPCTTVACFPINHEVNFRRLFRSPMDCVISALQYIGVLDSDAGNIMRITTVGSVGITQEQIEMIFAIKYRCNFNFKGFTDFNEFARIIVTLPIGNILFAGYKTLTNVKHVFIFVNLDGRIFYMDPQTINCDISDSINCAMPYIIEGKNEWYLLHQSIPLTPFQEQLIAEYVSELQNRVPLTVVPIQAQVPQIVPNPMIF